MAWFLFLDESGHQRRESPYEVLAGIAIQDHRLWPLIQDLHEAEINCFGRRYSDGRDELKGKKLLKNKVFRHKELTCDIVDTEISMLAKSALDDGANATVHHIKALALAKLNYVTQVFDIFHAANGKSFASIVDRDASPTATDGLRKDYAYLFERFFYFLEDMGGNEQGIIVFDELEKSQSHLLIYQMHKYFKEFAKGRTRSRLIVPEPLFVHSDLTTGIQIADLVAYCISWGFRLRRMTRPHRAELCCYTEQVANLRYRSERIINGEVREIWSFEYIDDLRTRQEREA